MGVGAGGEGERDRVIEGLGGWLGQVPGPGWAEAQVGRGGSKKGGSSALVQLRGIESSYRGGLQLV